MPVYFPVPMRGQKVSLWLASLILLVLLSACGEQENIVEVGVYLDTATQLQRIDGLKEGLKTFGYLEGKNIRFQQLNGFDFEQGRLEGAVKDFIGKNYKVYWTTNGSAADLLKKAGLAKQPLVVSSFSDPVARGLVQSIEQPGTNMTGIDSINTELTIKRLNWLAKTDSAIRSIFLLYDQGSSSQTKYLPVIRKEAARLNLKLVEKPLSGRANGTEVMRQLKAREAQAILTVGIAPLNQMLDAKELKMIVEREKLALIGGDRSHFDSGALIIYGSSYYEVGRQSAPFVSKILNGANPAQIPLEQPKKIELILNQKLATELGYKFSEALTLAADEVIK